MDDTRNFACEMAYRTAPMKPDEDSVVGALRLIGVARIWEAYLREPIPTASLTLEDPLEEEPPIELTEEQILEAMGADQDVLKIMRQAQNGVAGIIEKADKVFGEDKSDGQ